MSKKHIRVVDPNTFIRGLQYENDVLRGEVQRLKEYFDQLQHDNKKLEGELISLQEKQRELERSQDKAVHNFTHNSRDNIIATLKYDIQRLRIERDDSLKAKADIKAEIDDWRAKFSLDKNNQSTVALCDPYRPQKLTEMLSLLYDDKWAEAFEKSDGTRGDQEIATQLLNVFETVWKFCTETSEKQLDCLEDALMIPKGRISGLHPPESINVSKQMRRQLAKHMLPVLNQKFELTKMKVRKEIQPYVESCMELCWFSAIADPPLHYVFDATGQEENFRAYSKCGKNVDFVVWPVLYLCKHGVLMSKGIAQYKD